jgi:dTDP-4-dehydrorhamnose 3,5-epimerase
VKAIDSDLPGVVLIEPTVYTDARGFFMESFNRRVFAQLTGYSGAFVQDNHSRSAKNVLRGLHYQVRHAQGKLVRVTRGEAYDVAVDLRRGSTHFGRWSAVVLSEENRLMRWIPPGFAHGFLVTSDTCDLLYKTTDYWAPRHERTVRWDDPQLAIEWPLDGAPVLSDKDRNAPLLVQAEVYP